VTALSDRLEAIRAQIARLQQSQRLVADRLAKQNRAVLEAMRALNRAVMLVEEGADALRLLRALERVSVALDAADPARLFEEDVWDGTPSPTGSS
jgi:hypothetical protein